MLPLVFVNALHLDVEEAFRIDYDSGPLLDNSRQCLFIRKLHPAPVPVEFRIIGEFLQAPELFQIFNPARTDFVSDKPAQSGVAQGQKPPGSNTVRHIDELLRP